ncbi:MAG: hypothetical protein NC489_19615 [Ruminococcus flavefaciens]|nr:hypothetical protein [Ruminococcus flavefaciens]
MSYNSVQELFTGICDAIRKKEGSAGKIPHQTIPSRIMGIAGGEPAVYEMDISVDEVGFEYIPSADMAVTENDGTEFRDIRMLDSTQALGLGTASTAHEIYDATSRIVGIVCEALGMEEKELVIREYGWTSYLGLPGDADRLMCIGFSNYNIGYGYRMFYCSVLSHGMDGYTPNINFNREYKNPSYCVVDIYNSPLYMRYVRDGEGNTAFDFYRQNSADRNLGFQLADVTYCHEDGTGNSVKKCILRTDMSDYVLSARMSLKYGNNNTNKKVYPLTGIYVRDGYETLTGRLFVGYNMMMCGSVRMFTNICMAAPGDVLNADGQKYAVLYYKGMSYPTLVMKL